MLGTFWGVDYFFSLSQMEITLTSFLLYLLSLHVSLSSAAPVNFPLLFLSNCSFLLAAFTIHVVSIISL